MEKDTRLAALKERISQLSPCFQTKGEGNYSEGQMLKEIRKYLELNQEDMVDVLGVKQSTVSAHERRQTVNSKVKRKYLSTLGLTEEEFQNLKRIMDNLPGYDLEALMEEPEEAVDELVGSAVDAQEAEDKQRESVRHLVSLLSKDDLNKAAEYLQMLVVMNRLEPEKREALTEKE